MTDKPKQSRRSAGTQDKTSETAQAVRTDAEPQAASTAEMANGQAEMVMTMNNMAIDTFARACQAYFNGWATINGELTGFLAKRLSHDADLSSALARCESWEEAAELQRDWARVVAEEYAEEASRLMELTSEVTTQQWRPVWDQADKAVAEMTKLSH